MEVKIENKKYEFHHKAAQQEPCELELCFHWQISGFSEIRLFYCNDYMLLYDAYACTYAQKIL